MSRVGKSGRVPHLVVIIGPIASGKSTVARLLAARLREAGRAAAVLDLDDVVDTIGGFVGLDAARFRRAQIVHGELVAGWLHQGFDVVAPGPFFEPEEQEALLHAVPEEIVPRLVQLVTTYEVALERVSADADRGLSRHPELLRHFYDRVESLLPTLPSCDWSFDTTVRSSEDIVDELASSVISSER